MEVEGERLSPNALPSVGPATSLMGTARPVNLGRLGGTAQNRAFHLPRV
ncbi:Uncharacterised protein [uncultured archaeon]|nr:Uncharacterised protein [uncultured archaeon]